MHTNSSNSPIPYTIPNYTLHSHIAQGNAGTVYVATHDKNPNTKFAVKIIPSHNLSDNTRREVAIHIPQTHPNIIPLHCVTRATSRVAPHESHLALILEHAPAGDLFTQVLAQNALPARTARRRLTDIATALHHLHSNNIVHLDIKLENVVIANNAAAKLIDFGCAHHLDTPHDPQFTLGGTLHYLSPEHVRDPYTAPAKPMDAWALGVLLYTSLAGIYPFIAASTPSQTIDDNDKQTKQRILNASPHPFSSSMQVPSDLQRIVTGLLQKDPSQRMTIETVLSVLKQSACMTTPIRRSRFATAYIQQGRARTVSANPHSTPSHPTRTPSPAAPADADFELCPAACRSCHICRNQAKIAALAVVDSVTRAAQNQKSKLSSCRSNSTDESSSSNPTSKPISVSSPK